MSAADVNPSRPGATGVVVWPPIAGNGNAALSCWPSDRTGVVRNAGAPVPKSQDARGEVCPASVHTTPSTYEYPPAPHTPPAARAGAAGASSARAAAAPTTSALPHTATVSVLTGVGTDRHRRG